MSTKKPEFSELRIIGGKWRSRKINFITGLPGLRPTPNRVKETIFNWLAPMIRGANCLDAFAGSGSLGFEALSRGAKSVVMVDQSTEVIKTLQQNATKLQATNLELLCGNFPEVLKNKNFSKFNIVFLDPPFHQHLVEPCAHWLEEHDCLANEAYISVEVEYPLREKDLPANWQIIRYKQAGQVHYHLLRRSKTQINFQR